MSYQTPRLQPLVPDAALASCCSPAIVLPKAVVGGDCIIACTLGLGTCN